MAKKKKRRIQTPSLSLFDKGIYYVSIVVFLLAGFFFYPAVIGGYRRQLFQSDNILAISGFEALLVFLGLALGGGLASLMFFLLQKKQPIFGKANFVYGPPQWKPVYPLFSKQFWHNAAKNQRQIITTISVALLIILIAPILTNLCLQPRKCLQDDGSISVYNCLNENVSSYSVSDVEVLRIYTRTFSRKGVDNYGFELEFTMSDGEHFWFAYNEFRAGTDEIHGSISGAIHIKSLLDSDKIILEEQVSIQNVINRMNLNQLEIELLYELFEIEP